MKKRYQIDKQRAVQKFRRLATEVNPTVQMVLPWQAYWACSRRDSAT